MWWNNGKDAKRKCIEEGLLSWGEVENGWQYVGVNERNPYTVIYSKNRGVLAFYKSDDKGQGLVPLALVNLRENGDVHVFDDRVGLICPQFFNLDNEVWG